MWSVSLIGPVARPITILSKHASSIAQDTSNKCLITSVCKIQDERGTILSMKVHWPLLKKYMRKNLKTETVLKMVTNHHLHIRIETIFFKVSFLTHNTLFQPSTHFSSIVLQNSASGMRFKLFWISWMTSLSLSKNQPLRSRFKVRNNQKSQGVRSGLYAGCTITSMLRCSSHSWTRWTVQGCALSWWSIHHPWVLVTSSPIWTFFLAFVPLCSTYLCARHRYTVCLCLSCLLPALKYSRQLERALRSSTV